MNTTDISRPNFYEGQYLGAQDLLAAQEYQRQQDQRHRLAAHTWGIAAGLELEERPVPGGTVDVFIKPGYAVDGFGRAIVVLEAVKVPPALFAGFTLLPNVPKQLIPVWLRYREEQVEPPPAGYQLCSDEEQMNRIWETFRIVVGTFPASQQHAPIAIGNNVPFPVPDESVPHQQLPAADQDSIWLIPLGSVSWSGNQLVQSDSAATLAAGRRYLGVIGQSVLAPASELKLKNRASQSPLPANDAGVAAAVEGSLDVERKILGKSDAIVLGNLGVGTPNPQRKLHVIGDRIRLENNGKTLDLRGDGGAVDVHSETDSLYLRSSGGAGKNKIVLNPFPTDGSVGVGTETPAAKLEVAADWSGEEGALRITGDKPTIRLTGKQVAGDQSWIIHVGSNGPGNLEIFRRTGPAQWEALLSLTPTGRVGIGTSNPGTKLEVNGDLRVSNGGLFVGNSRVPVNVPVDVIAGERILNVRGGQSGANAALGVDSFQLTSRLAQASSANLMVALSHISNEQAALNARWFVTSLSALPLGPNTFQFNVLWEVDDVDGWLHSYSYVAIFVP